MNSKSSTPQRSRVPTPDIVQETSAARHAGSSQMSKPTSIKPKGESVVIFRGLLRRPRIREIKFLGNRGSRRKAPKGNLRQGERPSKK